MLLLLPEFKHRVLISHEKVKFSQVDPYGHLNANRYLEFMSNHRVDAAETNLECYTLDILKETGIGFAVTEAKLKFKSASYCSDTLEIASWLVEHNQKTFTVSFMISDLKSKVVKATADFNFIAIDVKSGRPGHMPEGLPSRSHENLLLKRPSLDEYLSTFNAAGAAKL